MQVKLPDFKGGRCLELDLCGFVIPGDAKGIKPPKAARKSLKGEYRATGGKAYIALILPFPFDKKFHIHLRIAREEFFSDEFPKPNSTPEEITALLDSFAGKQMDVKVGGVFRVQLHQFPAFIRSTFAETKADGIQVRMVGGTLEVTGTPIHRIAWKIEKAGKAQVDVEARTRLTLSENYLIEALDYLETAFNAFVSQEEGDE